MSDRLETKAEQAQQFRAALDRMREELVSLKPLIDAISPQFRVHDGLFVDATALMAAIVSMYPRRAANVLAYAIALIAADDGDRMALIEDGSP